MPINETYIFLTLPTNHIYCSEFLQDPPPPIHQPEPTNLYNVQSFRAVKYPSTVAFVLTWELIADLVMDLDRSKAADHVYDLEAHLYLTPVTSLKPMDIRLQHSQCNVSTRQPWLIMPMG